MAKGIAIGHGFCDNWMHKSQDTVDLLKSLSKEGVQMVQVRRMHMKNVHVMHLTRDNRMKILDDVACFSYPPNIALKWLERHLVEINNISKKPIAMCCDFSHVPTRKRRM